MPLAIPYDINDLLSRLKARGLNVAEDAAKQIIEDVFTWTEESIEKSDTIFDDAALGLVRALKKMAMEAADKIDGQPGA